jgi:hypothetical protein
MKESRWAIVDRSLLTVMGDCEGCREEDTSGSRYMYWDDELLVRIY